MKIVLLFLVVFCLVDLRSEAGADEVRAIDDFTRSLRQFTALMYYHISEGTSEADNIFFSPLSIAETLGMLMAGAEGKTYEQIQSALMVNKKRNYTHENFNKLFKKIYNKLFNATKDSTESEALLANRMFLKESYRVFKSFRDDLEEYFDSDTHWLDFSNSQLAAQIINGWVSDKTQGLITDLISPDSLVPLTRLVLVNALFFKASWKNEMKKYDEKSTFHAPSGDIEVPFMGQRKLVSNLRSEDLTIVRIPYQNDEADLVIIMPVDNIAMKKYSQWSKIHRLLRDLPQTFSSPGFHPAMLQLKIPMFMSEQSLDVKEVLQLMGVTDLFDARKANLAGIGEEQLHVSTFTHKAKIIVDHQGTTAAAASGAVLAGRSAQPAEINVNKPFFFGIYRKEHLLFFGRISNPVAP